MADKKSPKEASQLFHNIIKASVSPKATGAVEKKESHLEKFISAVKDKYGISITLDDGIVFPQGTNADSVIEIQNFYKTFKG